MFGSHAQFHLAAGEGPPLVPLLIQRASRLAVGQNQSAVLFEETSLQKVHGRPADEGRGRPVGRTVVQHFGPVRLLNLSPVHQHDAITERQSLFLIVRDIHHCRPQTAMEQVQLAPHFQTKARIEITERLVEQKNGRLAHQRPAERRPLLLPTRQLLRPPVEQIRQLQQPRRPFDALAPFRPVRPPPLPEDEAEAEVAANVQVGIEGGPLKDHRHVAPVRRFAVDDAAADADGPAGRRFQAGDHAQRRRLAATGRADQYDQLAVGDGQAQVVDRADAVGVGFADPLQNDFRHPFDPLMGSNYEGIRRRVKKPPSQRRIGDGRPPRRQRRGYTQKPRQRG